MKKARIVIGVVAALALVFGVLVVTDKLPWQNNDQPPGTGKTVTAEGGTFTFPDDMQVTVPKGALKGDATLRVSRPEPLAEGDAGPLGGLRSSGVAFDVSLTTSDKGEVQPLKPLKLTMPPKGMPAPNSVGQIIALPYTANDNGGYGLLPWTFGDGKLSIELTHLSPKYIAYAYDTALLARFFPGRIEQNRGECSQEATVAGQKVKIGPKSRGWSLNDNNSPIFACLFDEGGKVGVGVANRADYILSAAATSNLALTTSHGDYEEEVVKYVSRLFPAGEKIKAYLGRGGKLAGITDVQDLPATIEFQADPRTFMAENLFNLFGLAVGLLTGDGDAGRTLQLVSKLLEAGDMLTCAQKALAPLQGDADIGQIVSAGASCFGVLLGLLVEQLDLSKALKYLTLAVDALKVAVETIVSSANGIKLTLTDTLRVEVVSATPACPSGTEIKEAVKKDSDGPPVTEVQLDGELVCQDGWASTQVSVRLEGIPDVVGYSIVLHFVDEEWIVADSGQDMTGSEVCTQAPPKVIENVSCG